LEGRRGRIGGGWAGLYTAIADFWILATLALKHVAISWNDADARLQIEIW